MARTLNTPVFFTVQVLLCQIASSGANSFSADNFGTVSYQQGINGDSTERGRLPLVYSFPEPTFYPGVTSGTLLINAHNDLVGFSGLGDIVMARTLNTPVFFTVQVSYTYPVHCYRSDDRCLFLSPSPQTIVRSVASVCRDLISALLLQSGDVETNPGPSIQESLDQLLAGQSEMRKEIREINEKQLSLDSFVRDVLTRLDKAEKDIDALQKKERDSPLLQVIADIQQANKLQERRLVELENRSRKDNLVIFGIEEQPGETGDSLKDKVINNLFKTTLKVTVNSVDRLHRLGRHVPEKTRPVILHFQDHSEKMSVLKNCHLLKGSKVSVRHDLSQETIRTRKLLWTSAQPDKQNDAKVFLVHDKLHVNGDIYAWDDSTQTRVKLPSSSKKRVSTAP
ncbi:uncharacterized protein LOC115308770 [Ixodes scapularis]|uniref:uncharacterized protein LOC115308770 n=1 Tax=Ixodes scapularis TaxID=6945 RepID=UPI001AA000C8|nr:uncharacterized protein LOC115308770 [Ixodes scapularis]